MSRMMLRSVPIFKLRHDSFRGVLRRPWLSSPVQRGRKVSGTLTSSARVFDRPRPMKLTSDELDFLSAWAREEWEPACYRIPLHRLQLTHGVSTAQLLLSQLLEFSGAQIDVADDASECPDLQIPIAVHANRSVLVTAFKEMVAAANTNDGEACFSKEANHLIGSRRLLTFLRRRREQLHRSGGDE
jgi:hypothetical protein